MGVSEVFAAVFQAAMENLPAPASASASGRGAGGGSDGMGAAVGIGGTPITGGDAST